MEHKHGLFEIEERLRWWAGYIIHLNKGAIGYPSQSVTFKINDSTGPRFPTTGVCLIEKYEHSQQTDAWIRIMGRAKPEFADALHLYYACDMPLKDVLVLLGIGRRTLNQRVHDAKIWLAGMLSQHQQTIADQEAREAQAKPPIINWVKRF